MTNEFVLTVRSLAVEYRVRHRRARAVDDVSFELRRGQRLGIVGESGSGKSTLALALLGLIEPPGRIIGGDIQFDGRVISGLSDKEMGRLRGSALAIVFQNPMAALDPVKRIGDQVADALLVHQPDLGDGGAHRRAVELLGEVELPEPRHTLSAFPHQLSGGMRQRVMIAIALANYPSVLVADEPTTALDVTTQAQILDLLARLCAERNTAVILVTHNLGIVAEFCDRVAVMYAGRFVESATTRDLFRQPIHPYTEALLRALPTPAVGDKGRLPSIGGRPPSLSELPPGCSFEPRCPVGHGRDVCRTVRPLPVYRDRTNRVFAECHFAEERSQESDGR